ncbi:MarP family serine protease [Agromyces endophyticus]|uniref:MarP family serine protease n=1 Tax=Agromyces sp. H17E-10 TaxID=2932244 RepID=UPI001FD4CB17|nr:MarP family serine protease [Agromyces sp. H17E-10]UOQ88383.1 MarP family serine protease [Agromyces sp. H17E-10]
MAWSLVLDLLLVLVFIGAAVNGWRAGLLRTAAGLVGLVAGGIAAWFVMPWLAGLMPTPALRAPVAIAAALVLLSLGAWLGAIVGRALRRGVRKVKLGVLDRVLGVLGNLIVTAFVVALVASGVSALAVPVLSPAVGGSAIVRALDQITPPPAKSALAELRAAALGEGLPWLVDVLDTPLPTEAPPSDVASPAIAAASNSVVRITGTAFECGSNLSGSGFVVADDRIVTNAHVVAGVDQPIVEAPGLPAVAGRVVAFDPEHDLAVIAVDGLDAPALPLDEPDLGDEVAIAGYPFGGPLELRPGRVAASGPVTITTDGDTSTRDIVTLSAEVDHGNSGGPVLDVDGEVAGVVFARSEAAATVGFAIPVSTLEPLAAEASGLDEAVDSGSCAA